MNAVLGRILPTTTHQSCSTREADEEIFQIAHLCNCAWFAAVVLFDYFSAILGFVRKGSNWSASEQHQRRVSELEEQIESDDHA